MLTISSVRESISTRELTIIWRRVHNSRQAERCRAGSASRPRRKTSSGTAARSKSWRSSSRSEPSWPIPAIASSTVRSDSATKTLRGSSGRPVKASWAQDSRTSAVSASRRSTIEPTIRRSAGSQRRRENASEVDRIRRRSLTWVLSVRMFGVIVAEQAFGLQAGVLTCGRRSPPPLRSEDPAQAVGQRLRVSARVGQEVAHGVVDLAALLRQDLAKALLLGIELFVKRGLRHACAGHDVVDRRLVITARREHRQRSLGQAGTPLQASGFSRVNCAG